WARRRPGRAPPAPATPARTPRTPRPSPTPHRCRRAGRSAAPRNTPRTPPPHPSAATTGAATRWVIAPLPSRRHRLRYLLTRPTLNLQHDPKVKLARSGTAGQRAEVLVEADRRQAQTLGDCNLNGVTPETEETSGD